MQPRTSDVERTRSDKINVWAVVASMVGALAFFVGVPAVIFFGPAWLNHTLAWTAAAVIAAGATVAFLESIRRFRLYRAGVPGMDVLGFLYLSAGFFVLMGACGILDQGPYYEHEGGRPAWLTFAMIATFIGWCGPWGFLLLRNWIRRVAREALKEKDEPQAKPSHGSPPSASEPRRNGKTNLWTLVGIGLTVSLLLGLLVAWIAGPDWLRYAISWLFAGALAFLAYLTFMGFMSERKKRPDEALRYLSRTFELLIGACLALYLGLGYVAEDSAPLWLNALLGAILIGGVLSWGAIGLRRYVKKIAREALKEEDETRPGGGPGI